MISCFLKRNSGSRKTIRLFLLSISSNKAERAGDDFFFSAVQGVHFFKLCA
ncbi:hypothetical protein CHCC20331_0920 [Bacillus paralicheniformis]|nr:hypothetical protein CHCC20372_3776 [Bacillus paralicheniformis]TWK85767.1 hypothetical protein CHCC20331_0920 [Bacillus paralicheniformis]TWK91814.1 hypothetical protein CHCC20333_1404 [Bacillus paralicheniformis]